MYRLACNQSKWACIGKGPADGDESDRAAGTRTLICWPGISEELIGNRFWPSGPLARSLKPKACVPCAQSYKSGPGSQTHEALLKILQTPLKYIAQLRLMNQATGLVAHGVEVVAHLKMSTPARAEPITNHLSPS